MDCCGHGYTLTPRHWMGSTAPTSVGAMLAGDVGPRGSTAAAQTAETAYDALDVLRKSISVDVHTHGGKAGITSKAPPNDELGNAMRDRLPSHARPTCRTARSLAGIRRGFWPRCVHRSRASSTGTISSASLGWMRWSPTMACAAPFRRPISKPPIKRDSRRSSLTRKGSTFWKQSSSGSKNRINAASGTCSSCTTRLTTLAISRPEPSCTKGSPHSAPR